MDKSFLSFTPFGFKVIVTIWTILGLFFISGFLRGAFMIIQDQSQADFRFKDVPFFTIVSLLLSIVLPLVFVLYYYSRFTLKQWSATLLRWLLIISFPLLLYVWITIFPSMETVDIVYETVFFLLHIVVFLKFPGYFNVLRLKSN